MRRFCKEKLPWVVKVRVWGTLGPPTDQKARSQRPFCTDRTDFGTSQRDGAGGQEELLCVHAHESAIDDLPVGGVHGHDRLHSFHWNLNVQGRAGL